MTAMEAIFIGIALVAGFIAAKLLSSKQILKLEIRNAELTAQVKSEKAALARAGAELDMRFKATAHEIMAQNSEQFLQRAQEKLKASQADGAHDLEKRQKAIETMIDPVNKTLKVMDEKLQALENARVGAYAELQTHLKSMSEDQVRLRRETGSLVQALRSPATRGQWGEMQLRRCLEMAGMQAGVHFEEQVTANSGQRPDIIIKMTGGQTIVIDSKAPIEGYLDSLKEDATEEERSAGLDRHVRAVRAHMKTLGSKAYWEQFNTPQFVVMFLPGESYFSAALERDPSLIEAGVNEKVIPASPTTLISLLKAVMYGWRQEALAENAREISALGAELYDRVSKFGDYMGDIGKNLRRAVDSYNSAVGSLESRVFPSARRLETLHAAPQGKEIPVIPHIDLNVRPLTQPEALSAPNEATETRKRLA